jgi:phage shock protein A
MAMTASITADQVVNTCLETLLDPQDIGRDDRRDLEDFLDEYDRKINRATIDFWLRVRRELSDERIMQLYAGMSADNREDIARFAVEGGSNYTDKSKTKLDRVLTQFDEANKTLLGSEMSLEERNNKILELYSGFRV